MQSYTLISLITSLLHALFLRIIIILLQFYANLLNFLYICNWKPKNYTIMQIKVLDELTGESREMTLDFDVEELKVVDYSEKAIVVTGNTKLFKSEIKKLGGRYNPRLKCGQGWVFSVKKRQEVEDLVKWINILQKQLSQASEDLTLDVK